MSQYECNIEDLAEVPEKLKEPQVREEPVRQTDDQIKPSIEEFLPEKINRRVKTSTDVTPSENTFQTNKDRERNALKVIVNEMKDRKNQRIFLIIIGLNLLFNSSPVYKLINDMFPYLMESITQFNMAGKIAVSLLISCVVIISLSPLLNLT